MESRIYILVPEAFFLMITSKHIYKLSFDGSENVKTLPIDNIQSGSGLAFDSLLEKLYWSDVDSKQILSSHLNGTNKTVIVGFDLASPNSISFDWVTKYLYWTDNILNRIEVTKSDGTARKILIQHGLYKPDKLVVHPKKG